MRSAEKSNRSSIFLMELILAIFIFAIAGSICMQIFVRSHRFSEDAHILSAASLEVSSVSDILRSKDSAKEAMDGLESPLYFDNAFRSCAPKDAVYALVTDLLPSEDSTVLCYHVAVYPCSSVSSGIGFDNTDPICSTDVIHCIREEAGR